MTPRAQHARDLLLPLRGAGGPGDIRRTNVVKGVSLVTVGWAKGHIAWDAKGDMYPVAIDAETLRTVLECAKTYRTGLKVKVRHGSGPEDTCGHLSNFSVDGGQLRGDWTLYPTYDRYDHLVTQIATIPDTFGMSNDFSGPREFRDGYAYARCTEIYNCAVVDEPAANPDGLFDRSGGVTTTAWRWTAAASTTPRSAASLRTDPLPALAEGKKFTLRLQDSDDGAAFADIPELAPLEITGAVGGGAAAVTRFVRLPRTARRYLRASLTIEAAGGDNTAVEATMALVF